MAKALFLACCLLLVVGVLSATGGATTAAAAAAATTAVSGTDAATTTVADVSTTPAPANCTATFPDSYTRNTRFTILVGCAGFMLVAIVFFGLSCGSSSSVVHVLSFLACVTLALGYFTLWEGIGTGIKADLDGSCRVIFYGRFITTIITLPVMVSAYTLFTRVEPSAIIGGVGAIVLAISSWTIGATLTGPQKYVWWVIGLLCAVAEVVHLISVATASKRALTPNGASVANVAFIVLAGVLLGYATIWVIGATGTGYLTAATEIFWYVLLDAAAHVAIGFALVTSGESTLDGSFVPLLSQEPGANLSQAYGSGATQSYTPGGFPGAYESRQYV